MKKKLKKICLKLKNKKIILLIVVLFLLFGAIFGYFYFEQKAILEKQKLLEQRLEKQKKLEEQKAKVILEAIRKKQEYINSLDLKTDSSLTKFVSAKVPFEDKAYVPENLEKISGEYIYDTKGGSLRLRVEAKEALEKMAKDFYRVFEKPIVVVSAYRSYNYQRGIKLRGCPDNLCAKAGYSEHQSGLAADLWEATTQKQFLSKPRLKKYFDWLGNNAHKYGFTNTYTKGLEIDTYEIEPWHWRFVGVGLASYLKEKNLSLAEFYNIHNKKEVSK